jgi:hypothetical protein
VVAEAWYKEEILAMLCWITILRLDNRIVFALAVEIEVFPQPASLGT